MTGSITVSIELELAWGQHDKGGSDIYSSDRKAEELYLERLLETCEENNLSITFDTVGHLLLESCDGTHDGPHTDGWFDADLGTNTKTAPLFYWPEIPELIKSQTVNHELATHTFSHVLCDGIDDETLSWELAKCRELHERHGFDAPETIVTPRHREASREVLHEAGIKGIRTLKRWPRESFIGRYKQRALFWTLKRGHPAYKPKLNGDIVELYTTPYPSLTAVHLPNGQSSPLWPFQKIPLQVRKRIQRSYLYDALNTAIETGSNVHLWTHLYNMSNQAQWDVIEPFLERLGEAQENGEIEVLTMAELTHRYSNV